MTMMTTAALPGCKQYETLRKALQSGNRAQIDKTLESLVVACENQKVASEKQKIDDDQLNFWLNDVLPLLFDWENALTKEWALKASEALLPHLENTLYLDSPVWPALKTQISTVYSKLLEQARGRNDTEWNRKWSVLVRILDKEICQGAVIINVFLAIVENGFRSTEMFVREQSFDCWKLLVEIFAKYDQINIPKRVKLICIPLKSSKSKTETIATKKFGIWWFLITKLQSQLDEFIENVFDPFIYFCFGPSFKTPLCFYFDDNYQDFATPGKIYNSVKKLAAIALILMLGPAEKIAKTLLREDQNFIIPANGDTIISPKLFNLKARLLINSCTECTVQFSQMKDKHYLELNRCLWKNLLSMVEQEKAIPRSEMLLWIQENLAALISLSDQRKDDAMRELVYDTVLMVAQTNLLTVTIGHDSPEQLVNNYRVFMTLVFNPKVDYPENTSHKILSNVFDLRRYATTRGGYWDMLQKTTQYLSDLEPSLLTGPKGSTYRQLITHIYHTMAIHLKEQIGAQREQFEQYHSVALTFLLYPLEYDRYLRVEDIRDEWSNAYGAIVSGQKSCHHGCAFSEIIKAMTVAKYSANLSVIVDFFRLVLELIPDDFEIEQPPLKTLDLFRDLVRKALVFNNSLTEITICVEIFQKMIRRITIRGLLAVIMPIRNVINELVNAENGKLLEAVKGTLKTLVDRFVSADFMVEIKRQPKEVKWNCKLLISKLLELPTRMQKQWKTSELKNVMDICEGKDSSKAKANKKEGEFVVIEKVWSFTPDKLTEHQRDKMREKRDDIPALYNDMSQSQDSYVIKPWTPNKIVIPADSQNDHSTIVVCPSEASISVINGVAEASVPAEPETTAATETVKLDKENNNGNVQNNEKDEEANANAKVVSNAKKTGEKRSRTARELDQLRIDTIEGKKLQAARLARTRRSESVEPIGPGKRKSVNAKQTTNSVSAKTTRTTSRKIIEKGGLEKAEVAESSPLKKKREEKPKSSSPRKSLNFDNVVDNEPAAAAEAPSANSPIKDKAVNESVDEIVESSQANSQSMLARKFTLRKAKDGEEGEKNTTPVVTSESLPSDAEIKKELVKPDDQSPVKVTPKKESPRKNTRSVAAAAQQKNVSIEVIIPKPELPDTEPNTEVITETPITHEEKSKPMSPVSASSKPKQAASPIPEPMETEQSVESPKSNDDQNLPNSPNLSPVRNLDDQLEPYGKSHDRSFASSPEGTNQQERDEDLLNSTINISPISEQKAVPSTPSTDAEIKDVVTSGSGDKLPLPTRTMEREKSSVAPSPIARRTRNSPPMLPTAVANLKSRTPQMTPRSPSTNKIELRGRGAQFINLIRNQQNEASPKPPSSSGPSPQNASTPKQATPAPNDRSHMLRKLATTAAATSQSPEQPKPLEKEYLTFSKVLPSPQASPAVSILKRKLNHEDSGDDCDSPAMKRKRVSFHDPPVSITKEYIRQEEECRSPSINRCLQLISMSPSDKAKFLLRRKSKVDSLSELAKFTKAPAVPGEAGKDEEDEISSSPESLDEELININTTENMSALHVTTDAAPEEESDIEMKDTAKPLDDVEIDPQNSVPLIETIVPLPQEQIEPTTLLLKRTSPRKVSPKQEATEEPAPKKASSPASAVASIEKPDTTIRFQTEDDLLSHVISKYPLDTILERYTTAGKTLEQNKSVRSLTRELSTLMTKDSKTRYTVLDELSERHSAEFLDHAVQENSSAMVCQRLSMTTMTEYIFENLRKLPATAASAAIAITDSNRNEQEKERSKVLQLMFDNLLQMQEADGGADFLRMRDHFVRNVTLGKSRAEMMDLLEDYFNSSRTKSHGSSSSSSSNA
ncbi:telomere-associated protein RIF1 isoform X2 [Toxorhynchites rutilus septentrionalis]|nr:telomere-associated protein RIF1 isoform X2 [Toxorhynchites rutilus septentrionalis]